MLLICRRDIISAREAGLANLSDCMQFGPETVYTKDGQLIKF